MSAMRGPRQECPAALPWRLAGLPLGCGRQRKTLKIGLSEVRPLLFRSLCPGFGATLLFARCAWVGPRVPGDTGDCARR